MRFKIQRQHFLKVLRAVAGVVERHKQAALHPVLGQVLIRVADQKLSLIATDQEIELLASTSLLEPEAVSGEITVAIRKLLDICSSVAEDQVLSFVVEQGGFIIRAGRGRFKLSILSAQSFPAFHATPDPDALVFSVSRSQLRTLMAETEFAMAEKDLRSYLNAMLWEVKERKLYCVAADGHRLAFGSLSLDLDPLQKMRMLLPRKAILGLQRTFLQRGEETTEDMVQISISARHFCAQASDLCLNSVVLEPNFPDFWRIINTAGDKVLKVGREALKQALHRAAALLGDRSKGVRLELSAGLLKILATNADQDEIEEELAVDYQGPPLVLGFNLRYLTEFLAVLQSEDLSIDFSNSESAARLKGLDEGQGIYVIMPMSI